MSDELLVRTYNIGCGDCIFLRVPDASRPVHILVDCGNFFGDAAADLRRATRDILGLLNDESLPEDRRGRLDLLVATHQHWDHLKGFEAALGAFKDLHIERIWISVAMKEDHAEAHGLRALREHVERTVETLVRQRGLAFHPGLYALLMNSLSAQEAAKAIRGTLPDHNGIEPLYVYRGFESELSEEQSSRYLLRFQDPSIRLHVLAPERDVDGAYMGLAQGVLKDLHGSSERVIAQVSKEGRPPWPMNISRSEFRRLQSQLLHTSLLAASLENSVLNNTSVVLLLEWRGRRLLLPGDAEHESWGRMWQEARERLDQRVDFLKVSHHGSHNGTPFDLEDPANPINAILDAILPKGDAATAQAVVTTLDGRIHAPLHPVPYPELMNEIASRVANAREYPDESGPQPQRTDREEADWIDVKIAPAVLTHSQGEVEMPENDVHVCIDRSLPRDLLVAAAEHAIAENPGNRPAVAFSPGLGVAPIPPWELAALTAKKWSDGRKLRVRFLDGLPEVQARLQPFAHQWSEYANLTFEFGDDADAEVRISFQGKGSWSYIGTDALAIPKNQPTMNFGWLTPQTSDDEYSRVVIHEFGHALGCIHEHQSPEAEIPWDKEKVYAYYAGPPNFWTREQVDLNLFTHYSRDVSQFSEFDRNSIMLYSIPKEHLTDPSFAVGWNRILSKTDKSFIGVMYPKAEKAVVDLTPGARSTQASIGAHGEEDLYRFEVDRPGRYSVQTGGWTDVVMTLSGPDDETRQIAQDDDSGFLRNARVIADLEPGAYYVRIRHFRPTGRGRYSIRVALVK